MKHELECPRCQRQWFDNEESEACPHCGLEFVYDKTYPDDDPDGPLSKPKIARQPPQVPESGGSYKHPGHESA